MDVSRSDVRLWGRAVREGWPVPAAMRPGMVEELVRIVEHGKPWQAIRAARILIAMDEANLRAEQGLSAPSLKGLAYRSELLDAQKHGKGVRHEYPSQTGRPHRHCGDGG